MIANKIYEPIRKKIEESLGDGAFARQAFNERIVNGELEAIMQIKDMMEV